MERVGLMRNGEGWRQKPSFVVERVGLVGKGCLDASAASCLVISGGGDRYIEMLGFVAATTKLVGGSGGRLLKDG